MDDASVETLIRAAYAAYPDDDRQAIEAALSDDFTFSSPDDPHLDREGYFERCWANRHLVGEQRIEQILHRDGDVLVRYTSTRPDGTSFRNAEYMRVEGGKITRTEVFYGAEVAARQE